MPLACWLMAAAALPQATTAMLMYLPPGKPTSPACSSFTASLLPYTWYYLHWLTAPMVDGKKSRVAGYLKPPTQ